MAEDIKRPLKVFLCHAHEDKAVVRKVYKRLVGEGIDAWLDSIQVQVTGQGRLGKLVRVVNLRQPCVGLSEVGS